MVRAAALIATLFATPVIAQQDVPDLLICHGSSIGEVPDGGSDAVVTDNYGNVITGRQRNVRTAELNFTVQLRLRGAAPRINLPRFAAPDIASSRGGWFRVKNLEIERDYIRGKAVFNFLSASRFEVDRRTGIMTTENGYRGLCEAGDTENRAF